MQFTTDLSGLAPEVRQQVIRKLQHSDRARYDVGVANQLRLKKFHDQVVQPGAFNEVGPMQMVIGSDQYQRALQTYGQLCFMDPDFVPFLLRKHEDMRVKSVGTRIQSGWTAASGDGKTMSGPRGSAAPPSKGFDGHRPPPQSAVLPR